MAAELMSCIPEHEVGHVWVLKVVTTQACFRSTSAAPPVVAGKTAAFFEAAVAMVATSTMPLSFIVACGGLQCEPRKR